MKTQTQNTRFGLRSEDGQAIVEFAIILPLLVLLVMGTIQFGVAFRNYLAITDAARVGARAAAVKRATACDTAEAAIERTVSSKQWDVIKTRITCSSAAGTAREPWTVSIVYPYKLIGLPGVDSALLEGNLTGSATERME
jgi:Flp pilus assembly protein TadG